MTKKKGVNREREALGIQNINGYVVNLQKQIYFLELENLYLKDELTLCSGKLQNYIDKAAERMKQLESAAISLAQSGKVRLIDDKKSKESQGSKRHCNVRFKTDCAKVQELLGGIKDDVVILEKRHGVNEYVVESLEPHRQKLCALLDCCQTESENDELKALEDKPEEVVAKATGEDEDLNLQTNNLLNDGTSLEMRQTLVKTTFSQGELTIHSEQEQITEIVSSRSKDGQLIAGIDKPNGNEGRVEGVGSKISLISNPCEPICDPNEQPESGFTYTSLLRDTLRNAVRKSSSRDSFNKLKDKLEEISQELPSNGSTTKLNELLKTFSTGSCFGETKESKSYESRDYQFSKRRNVYTKKILNKILLLDDRMDTVQNFIQEIETADIKTHNKRVDCNKDGEELEEAEKKINELKTANCRLHKMMELMGDDSEFIPDLLIEIEEWKKKLKDMEAENGKEEIEFLREKNRLKREMAEFDEKLKYNIQMREDNLALKRQLLEGEDKHNKLEKKIQTYRRKLQLLGYDDSSDLADEDINLVQTCRNEVSELRIQLNKEVFLRQKYEKENINLGEQVANLTRCLRLENIKNDHLTDMDKSTKQLTNNLRLQVFSNSVDSKACGDQVKSLSQENACLKKELCQTLDRLKHVEIDNECEVKMLKDKLKISEVQGKKESQCKDLMLRSMEKELFVKLVENENLQNEIGELQRLPNFTDCMNLDRKFNN
ncbi:hypothetical protein SNEBB_009816 [Seison nebaliae]|nr:hypothetical protein SNEBB_009816 [Seison nebaliae]